MFDEVYFQFSKLGFLLFFFLACEALCPLRSNPLYFPRTAMFSDVGVKPPLWIWIAKWAMISFLIVALMSPVRDLQMPRHGGGWDILLILDPSSNESEVRAEVSSFIDRRPDERIALWIPPDTVVPMTYEHDVLKSILMQTSKQDVSESVQRTFGRFFATSEEGKGLAVIVSNKPDTFVKSLPTGVQTALVSPLKDRDWIDTISRKFPSYKLQATHRYFEYYYIYPLFLAFLFLLAYLYGRNQKGIK
ncbi:MAG: hypothetical protein PHQ90_04815 [Sulfuricurvum sp.]|uniref:hypothetical protein n=1 Tax=Sulfuricurvum sp. TaxID=2025608 RepID=UPI002621D8E7|nr:hypothetical protein [Sulfuricurvum sp.]MDD2368603.1 hypothetical protein [Sulfuricurvum sp.]MDD5119171.1 hypothetical protein [Sulfuricurvum sp.]